MSSACDSASEKTLTSVEGDNYEASCFYKLKTILNTPRDKTGTGAAGTNETVKTWLRHFNKIDTSGDDPIAVLSKSWINTWHGSLSFFHDLLYERMFLQYKNNA